MIRNIRFFSIIFFLYGMSSLAAQETEPLVYRINIRENIGSNTWVYLRHGLHEASKKQADVVLIDMNTYGGSVLEADSMRTAILNYPKPVYVFIDNNAASAGALISIACDSIYMRESASIGAATVVNGTDGAAAPDKYQAYMRGIMRGTAESHGQKTEVQDGDTIVKWRRDPKIAEAMVDERIVVPGFVDSAQVLVLTAHQAVDLGFCDGIVENVNELITKELDFKTYRLETYNPTIYDNIKGFLTNGVFQAFLIMFIIGGIYMELQSPGIGFPTAVAITAALLYFTPLYLTGYAQSWEVLLFVLGLILIVFEIFVIPGFGFTGIAGIVCLVAGLLLALINNIRFCFDGIPSGEIFRALMIVFAGLGSGTVVIVYLSSRIGKPGVFRKVALAADQEGFVSVPMEPSTLVGKTGLAATVLRPSGRVLIDGDYYDAVSLQGFIEEGEEVVVKRYENFQLAVVATKKNVKR
ncbi:MAG: nodulation protein NfeD [Dysgonamonadaceae bacterium]|jgi:membrane-bound serine protease (ClpP class)|nr:nodulation protein NfeD [Dysgonamonadaceae bacterium]